MNYLKNIIIKFITKDLPKPLGRWKIENCNKIINNAYPSIFSKHFQKEESVELQYKSKEIFQL
jgi:hypothetical protein